MLQDFPFYAYVPSMSAHCSNWVRKAFAVLNEWIERVGLPKPANAAVE